MRWLSPNSCHRYPAAIAARYASKTCGSPINAASIARWLVTGSWKPVSNPSTDRTGFPGRTKRRVNPCRGRTPSGVQADSSARTTVVPMAMTRCPPSRVRLVRGDEPQPGDAWIWCDVPGRRIAHAGLLARLDRHGAGMRRIPPRLGEPQAFRVPRAQVERVRTGRPVGLEARRQRGTFVRDEEVSRGEESRQVGEGHMLVSRWRRHEETHRVPVSALFHLHGCGREQLARLLEEEFL